VRSQRARREKLLELLMLEAKRAILRPHDDVTL
jgi:hypothetical protein